MAKGNMLLGQSRGKLGDLVMYRANGEQITRAKAASVKNPKTSGQMIQRMIFATIAAAYARMKSITDHSFEGVPYGAKTQQKFMSENLKRLRAFYPKDQDPDNKPINTMAFALPNNKAMAGTGLIIARGSLPAPEVNINAQGVLIGFGDPVGDIKISSVLDALGARVGDQITIVGLVSVGNGYQFVKSRYVVDVNATAEQLEANWTPNGSAAAFDKEKTIVGSLRINAAANDLCTIEDESGNGVAVAIIISRRDESGKWLRSDAILYNATDEAAFYSAAYALPYWKFSGTDIATDDPRYLNNADI